MIHAATLISPAKINLHLEILGIREDGYHELKTLFYPVEMPCDLIKIEPGQDEHFYIRCPERPDLESTSNLIYKAWKAFGEATGFQPGIFVTLTKRIPTGGGLGGGSSNAATMLRWLNDTAGDKALTQDQLVEVAVALGADVPFFLMDGPAWAGGIGEKLTPAEVDISGMTLLVACPAIHVDTPWAFGAWDEKNDFPTVPEALTTNDSMNKKPTPVSPQDMVNDFEPVVFEKHPMLQDIKEKLIELGAETAAMSGSGASLFGLFHSRDEAMTAANELEKSGIEIFTMDCR